MNPPDGLLTLPEVAGLLRVSRHTVQAWVSPSSPNHRSEFAALARHAGRKTVFSREEVKSWLAQRQGMPSRLPGHERSPYWLERFIAGRGLLKRAVTFTGEGESAHPGRFRGGMLGLDSGPLLSWLVDGPAAPRVLSVVRKAEGLVLPISLMGWLQVRLKRMPARARDLESYLLDQGIFETAPLDEPAIRRLGALPGPVPEWSALHLVASLEYGAKAFATWTTDLLEIPGLPVISP